MYNGSVCFPQVPLPANFTAEIGKNATIQIVEAAQHGAALYNVSHPEARARDPLVGGGGVWLTMCFCSAWTSPLPTQKMCRK